MPADMPVDMQKPPAPAHEGLLTGESYSCR